MGSVTLAQSAKLAQNELVEGVIENVITVNQMFRFLPFHGIDGNALAYNRENALGAVQMGTVGTVISAGKAPASFTQVTSSLTTIVGDAEVNGLIQATRSNPNNQKAIQVASKAKSAGRQYQDMLVTGTGTNNQFTGLLSLVDSSQIINHNGALTLAGLDQLIDQVTDKDGEVDFIMCNARTRRTVRTLLRALGGAGIVEAVEMPGGGQIMAYNGIPIFRNDWIPINQTAGSLTSTTTILAGNWDDGSQSIGISGLTARSNGGLQVEEVGISETKDETITRVKWYCGLALFNLNGLAALKGVTD